MTPIHLKTAPNYTGPEKFIITYESPMQEDNWHGAICRMLGPGDWQWELYDRESLNSCKTLERFLLVYTKI